VKDSPGTWFDAHLSAGSLCIDSGDSSIVAVGDVDFDGGSRVVGSAVDIGADESDPNLPVLPPTIRIVRVSPPGDDLNDGSSWTRSMRSVRGALSAATWDGPSQIWVAAGTYIEQISLRPFIHLCGGFAGNETSLDQRDLQTNGTILDGNQADSVITALAVGNWSTVDGLTIRNGRSSRGAGVAIDSCSPTIANCVIQDNLAIAANPQFGRGGGIQCYNAFGLISNNVFRANSAGSGGGIYCEGDFKTKFSQGPFIFNNRLIGNTTTNAQSQVRGGAGIFVTGSSPVIANNLLTQNTAWTTGNGLSFGGGMLFDQFSQSLVANNTIVNNTATNGGGICLNGSSPTLVNNLVAFGTSGLRSVNSTSLLQNNCVFGNTVTNYDGIADPTGTNGNISVDPLLVSTTDLHLGTGSPCIDAGDDTVVGIGWRDVDGQVRNAGEHVDIGADEFGSPLPFHLTLIASSGTGPTVLRLGSEPGQNYVFEGAAEFSTWLPFSTNLATNTTIEVSDTAPGSAARFYRARTVPP
jgi:predicted outer membrane repeat protein